MKENKHERFKRVASKRMQNVLKEMSRLENCSNTNTYNFTTNDVNKMTKTLSEKIQEIRISYKKGLSDNNEFKF